MRAAVERYTTQKYASASACPPRAGAARSEGVRRRRHREPVEGGTSLGFAIRHRDDGAARPQELIDLIAEWAGVEPVMRGLERRRVTWDDRPPGQRPGGGRS